MIFLDIKKMYIIKEKEPEDNEKKAIERPAVIYPTKVLKISDDLKKKLAKIFSYKIILINALDSNIDKVFAERICSFCGQSLYFADCYHKKNNLRASLLRFCHYCKTMFILTGRFEEEEQFDKAFDFFDDYIYLKKKNIEEGGVLNESAKI